MGIGRTLTGSWIARAEAGFRHASRARAELRRGIRGSFGANQGLCGARSSRAGSIRLASLRQEPVESRAAAPRLAASQNRVIGQTFPSAAHPISRVHPEARLQTLEILQRQRALDPASP